MPDKDPGLLGHLLNSPITQGIVAATLIAVLRGIYDRKQRWKRVLIEALLCGSLTAPGAKLVEMLAQAMAPGSLIVTETLPLAVGGAIGFLGVVELRRLAWRYLGIKVTDEPNQERK
ncbi:phage holin, lambda family [compost metagenome]